MNDRKQGLKALCLSFLAVLGLIAFTATAAQASGNWMINGSALKSNESISGASEGSSVFKVPSIKLEISCKEATVSGTLELNGLGKETMTFTKCESPGLPGCSPIEPITAKFLSEMLLHAEEPWLIFRPPVKGGSFTTIFFDPAKCALPEENELTGAFAALLGKEETTQHLLSFIAGKTAESLFGLKYSFGINPAELAISSIWELSGANKGKVWGGV